MVTSQGTGSWQRRGKKGEAEARPTGRSEDENAGMAQEGFMLRLDIGSEAPERCHRRRSAPYSALTLVHHTHESGEHRVQRKPPASQLLAGQPSLGSPAHTC